MKEMIGNRSDYNWTWLSPRVISKDFLEIVSSGVLLLCLLFSSLIQAQVGSSIDTTEIRIGEEIQYTVSVAADSTDLVVFPEGQTFLPLEVIESYKIDTTYEQAKMRLIKKYGLTQFDSGRYTIPQQKIAINERMFTTDSFRIEVRDVPVDTTKQKMFEIKPAIEVDRPPFNFWEWLPWIIGVLVLIGMVIYIFFRRKKIKDAKEQQLPPYEEALVALETLDKSALLRENKSKEYYSHLTTIVKRYLDREVDDMALESTSDELIQRMNMLRDGGNFEFDREDIKRLDAILKRADLVKFAKMQQAEAQALEDRSVVEEIINHTHEAVPEPTEEELLENELYLEAQRKKRQRRRYIFAGAGVILALLIAAGVYGSIYGFDTLKDDVLGNEYRDLAEGRWYKSEYGSPEVILETPEILVRTQIDIPEGENVNVESATVFSSGEITEPLYVLVSTTQTKNAQEEVNLDPLMDAALSELERRGALNMIVKREDFETEKGIKGLRAYGNFNVSVGNNKVLKDQSYYELLLFAQQNGVQTVLVVYQNDGRFSVGIKDRIINSVELEIQETKDN
ncbi:MAG: BatD family protein [Marinirhabdus sp.]|nr:BatD family protein [Marinirhabdus sp.]